MSSYDPRAFAIEPEESDWSDLLKSTCLIGADYWLSENGFTVTGYTENSVKIHFDGKEPFGGSFDKECTIEVTVQEIKEQVEKLSGKALDGCIKSYEERYLKTILQGSQSWDAEVGDFLLQMRLFNDIVFG